MSKHNKTGRSKSRYVCLYHWVLDSPAWLSLSPNARSVYVELAKRYTGSNNGRIPLSVREAAERVGIGKDTANRALIELQEAGFVKITRQGFFHGHTRKATEWELTEFPVGGAAASKDFMHPKIHSSVSPQGHHGLISGTPRSQIRDREDPKPARRSLG